MTPIKQRMLRYQTIYFYAFAFAIAWTSWLFMWLVYEGGTPGPIVYVFSTLGALGPLASLGILDKATQGQVSLKQVFAQIKIRGAPKTWFLLAIFVLPAITLVDNLAYYLLGYDDRLKLIRDGPDAMGVFVVLAMMAHFVAALITSPLFEEPGWRGFALGRLQRQFGRNAGSLIVGVLWWVWHQPMNLTFGFPPTVYSFVSMVALSFMIDSLYNLSGKNLFTAMLAHQSSGTVLSFLEPGENNGLYLTLLIGFVVWLRLRECAPSPTNSECEPHCAPPIAS